jgi:phage shock protein C
MALADELAKLEELQRRGALSDEEFSRAKARTLDGAGAPDPAAGPARAAAAINALRRTRAERWIGGVCAGIGRATGIEAWVWRLLFALLALCGGAGLVLYVLLWIFVPAEAAAPGSAA